MAERKRLHTELCDMLGIEYPIILAGMGTVAGPSLVAAVSNAGGLGVLGAIDLTPEELRDAIRRTKSLTDKPFGVDTVFPAGLPERDSVEDIKARLPAEAVAFVNKLREKLGVPEVTGRPFVQIISREVIKRQVEVILEERIPVLASGLGNPAWVIPEAHAQGVKVISLVGNTAEARRLAQAGCDIIVAQGYEAGGHTGAVGSLALIPQVVDAVYPTPVVAAGGIADGRGLVAALALGAIGVWVGTAFVATHEASREYVELGAFAQWEIDRWKEKLLEATEEDTRITRVYTGKTLRQLRNKFFETWEGEKGPYLKGWPLQALLIGDLLEGIRQSQKKDYVSWMPTGQIVGMIKEIKSARQVVDEMVAGAIELLGKGLPAQASIRK